MVKLNSFRSVRSQLAEVTALAYCPAPVLLMTSSPHWVDGRLWVSPTGTAPYTIIPTRTSFHFHSKNVYSFIHPFINWHKYKHKHKINISNAKKINWSVKTLYEFSSQLLTFFLSFTFTQIALFYFINFFLRTLHFHSFGLHSIIFSFISHSQLFSLSQLNTKTALFIYSINHTYLCMSTLKCIIHSEMKFYKH